MVIKRIRRENDRWKQKGQENTFLGWNAKYPPYFIIYFFTTDRKSTDEIVCHISFHFIFIRNLWRYETLKINRFLSLSLSLSLSLYVYTYMWALRFKKEVP